MASAPHTWPRLFTGTHLAPNLEIALDSPQTHYILNVMRTRAGTPIRLFNGRDGEWVAPLPAEKHFKKGGLLLTPEKLFRPQAPEPDLWLCAAPVKRANLDFMVMKATELGISVFQPLLTARTQIRTLNTAHLRAVAIEAAEQSERLSVPEIRDPVPLEQLLSHWPENRRPVLCAETGPARPIAQALLDDARAPHSSPAAVLTGPEGGFESEEFHALGALPGLISVRLGPRILRAETAALAGLACWQALCGDWQKTDL